MKRFDYPPSSTVVPGACRGRPHRRVDIVNVEEWDIEKPMPAST